MGMALVTKHVVSYCQRKKPFNQLYITNKTKHFSFKSGRAMHVAKLTKIDWLVVLQ